MSSALDETATVPTTRPGSAAATAGLIAAALAFFIQAYDVAGMGLALNQIGDDLHRGIDMTQWVVNALALGYAVTIVLAGRLADMLGAGRLLATGLCVFALGSGISATAPNIELLIAGRAVSGIGVGMMWPAGLAFAYKLVSPARAAIVGGLCVGAIAAGNAVGPIIAGLLVDGPGWRWVLVVNIPASVVAVLFVLRARSLNPEPRAKGDNQHLDYGGAAMLGLSLAALLVALDRTGGEHQGGLVFYAASATALAAFIAVERGRGARSLVPPSLFRQRNFLRCCLAIAAIAPAFWTALVYLPLLAQRGLGYSATLAGAAMLPMMLTFMVASFLSGSWYAAFGPKLLISIGAAAIAAGAVVLMLMQHPPAYFQLAVGMAAIGLGIGVFFSSITTVAALSVEMSLRGVAMGVLYTAEIIGGAIGLAGATALFSRSDRGATALPALIDSFGHVFMMVAITAVVGLVISLSIVVAPETAPAATEGA